MSGLLLDTSAYSAMRRGDRLRLLTLDERFKSVPYVLIEYFDPLA